MQRFGDATQEKRKRLISDVWAGARKKGVFMLGRGENFNHKKKNHPGNFPSDSLTERHTTEAQEDEELIVTQEAFKNRVEKD